MVNTLFNRREKIFDSKVVRKYFISLLPKITTIEENKGIDALNLYQLVGNVKTLDTNHFRKKIFKGLALNTKT